MWDANEVDRRKAEYWAAERRERRDDASSDETSVSATEDLSVPRGGWTAYDPKPSSLNVAHATVYRLDKGEMLTAGGFNTHEGLPVTRGARYIVAGFVGLNRHCCAFKHAGWRGLLGFLRVFMLKRVDAEYGTDTIPPHDWRMYEEGRRALRGAFFWLTAAGLVGASAVAALARRGGPTATLRAWRRRRKRRGLLPSKSYD